MTLTDASSSKAKSPLVGRAFEVGIGPAPSGVVGTGVVSSDELAKRLAGARVARQNILIAKLATPGREAALRGLLRLQRWALAVPNLKLAPSEAGLSEALSRGLVAVLPSVADAQSLGEDLEDLADLSAAGIGVMSLLRDWKGPFGDGALERTDLPLTVLGVAAVERLNAAHVVIDLAGAGRRSSLQAIDASAHPTIFSHVGIAAVWSHPSSITDDQAKACARRGGVIGLGSQQSVDRVIAQLDYLIGLVGFEHVALGTELEDAPAIQAGLRARGMSEGDIVRISGGNLRRVIEHVWRGRDAGRG